MIQLKAAVAQELEKLRVAGTIGGSLDAEVEVFSKDEFLEKLKAVGEELRFLLITSDAKVKRVSNAAGPPVGAIKVAEIAKDGGVWVRVQASAAPKCERCWHHRPDVGSNPEHPTICGRCVDNVDGPGRISTVGMSAPTISFRESGLRWLWLAVLDHRARPADQVLDRRDAFPAGGTVYVLPVFNIIHTYNPGAAWSMFADAGGAQRWVFSALAIVVSIVLVYWLRRLALATHTLLVTGLTLILGGAIGNVIDRLRLGHVDRLRAGALERRVLSGVQRGRLGHHHRRGLRDPRCAARIAARAAAQARSGVEQQMKILLANPRGFCAGVDRAIDIVERAIAMFGAPIYVRHEVVHNVHVVERLRELGAVFVDELRPGAGWRHGDLLGAWRAGGRRAGSRAPRAHGVRRHLSAGHQGAHGSGALRARSARRGADRPCRPPGSRRHHGPLRHQPRRAHASHRERGAGREAARCAIPAGWRSSRRPRCRWTTPRPSSAKLRERFPTLASPRREDICYATQNRQDAVKELIASCDVLIVVGSITSSNSNRLRELAERAGRPGYLIDDASFLKREWFEGKEAVGVTAGASAPEELVQQVVARLREWGGTPAEELKGREEHVVFSLPARAADPPSLAVSH